MTMFRLPEFERLIMIEYNFSEFQNHLVNRIVTLLSETFTFQEIAENEIFKLCVISVSKYYINLFTQSDNEEILMYSFLDNYVFYRFTNNPDSVVKIMSKYISENFTQYGILTKFWEPLDVRVLLLYGSTGDVIMHVRSDRNIFEDNQNDSVSDALFEMNREDVIEKTFNCNQNHEIIVNNSIIDRNSENTECKLCYEHSNYLCTICGYPICNKCMEHLKTSTGKCPCCQTYPLSLNNISEEVKV